MSYILALHIEDAHWKVALLHFNRGRPQILLVKTIDREQNPLEVLKTVLHKKPYQIATALEARDWILRRLELETKGWKNLLSALPFQAEDLIPFPKEQTVAIAFLEEETKTSSKICLVATKHDFLKAHLDSMSEMKIEPHFVTTTVHALKRWMQFSNPGLDSAFLLYAHKEKGFAAFFQKNEIVEFKVVSLEHTGSWQRIKDYFLSLSDKADTIPWFTLGEIKEDPVLQEYALPIGIALDAAYGDRHSIQFRTGKFEPATLQKKKKTISQLSLLCLTLSVLAFGPIGYGLLHKHQQALVPRAHQALEKIGIHSKEDKIDKLLDILDLKRAELEQEKRFGPHFPMATWFLEKLDHATRGIEIPKLPQLTSLEYRLDAEGNPQLHIRWTSSNKEALKSIKRNLQGAEGLRIVKWQNQAQTQFIVLERL